MDMPAVAWGNPPVGTVLTRRWDDVEPLEVLPLLGRVLVEA